MSSYAKVSQGAPFQLLRLKLFYICHPCANSKTLQSEEIQSTCKVDVVDGTKLYTECKMTGPFVILEEK
jgi:hypothetical protein